MDHPGADDWEDLAQREPYFPLLGTDGSLATEGSAQPSDQFFATGELDVSALLAALESLLGHEVPLGCVLDFGCGVGRLSVPLAKRARQLVACDIAPTMLSHAREHARRAGLANIRFVQGGDPAELTLEPFDFICSLGVFRHVRAWRGYALIRSLAHLLAPGGIAAIELPLRSSPRRVPRRSTVGARLRVADVLPRGIDMPANVYNERRVLQTLETAGTNALARLAIGGSETDDTVLVFGRR